VRSDGFPFSTHVAPDNGHPLTHISDAGDSLMTRRSPCLFAAAVLLVATGAAPDPVSGAKAYLRGRMNDLHIPGLSVAVVREGRIVMIWSHGKADLEHKVRATNDTVYELASVSKPFVATAVMKLANEGKLGLGDPVRKYIPDTPPDWDEVTIRHLLNHTTGIKEYLSLPGFNLAEDLSDAELVRRVAQQPLEFRPGRDWAYSNTNYALLGMVVSKASRQWFGDYLAENVFRPGMTATRVNAATEVIPNRASGYIYRFRQRRAAFVSPSQLALADTALISTITDLATWESALVKGHVLPQKILDKMWAPTILTTGETVNYGLGWTVEPPEKSGAYTRVCHGGRISGFSCEYSRFIGADSTLTVILLTNAELFGDEPYYMAGAVASYFLTPAAASRNESPRPPSRATPRTDRERPAGPGEPSRR
jgi:D-alanyl-D-alanine carboxypeptidase